MQLTINGTIKNFDNINTLNEVVGQTIAKPLNIIAELNGTIIHRDAWDKTNIKDGDVLELVTFVGGG